MGRRNELRRNRERHRGQPYIYEQEIARDVLQARRDYGWQEHDGLPQRALAVDNSQDADGGLLKQLYDNEKGRQETYLSDSLES